jgi:hypothetical protein
MYVETCGAEKCGKWNEKEFQSMSIVFVVWDSMSVGNTSFK